MENKPYFSIQDYQKVIEELEKDNKRLYEENIILKTSLEIIRGTHGS